MIVKKEMVQKLTISDVSGLDPIAVYLEDQGTGQGKITITCYGQAWTSFWGAMGKRTISEFVSSSDNQYLAKNLSSVPYEINDVDKLVKDLKRVILKNRRSEEINATDARIQFDSVLADDIMDNHGLLNDVYGDEWWYNIPKKPNPDYLYLFKILDAVKEALSK